MLFQWDESIRVYVYITVRQIFNFLDQSGLLAGTVAGGLIII
jgi:hypothetical protein